MTTPIDAGIAVVQSLQGTTDMINSNDAASQLNSAAQIAAE